VESVKDGSESALEHSDLKSLGSFSDYTDKDFLRITQESYDAAVQYMDSSLRVQWERNIANFYSRHPSGSKYHTEAYKCRSRLFRPKTRASVRQKEAALALALFSTSDMLSIKAEDQGNGTAVMTARVLKEIVDMRLRDKRFQWFQIAIAAFQDASVVGTVISYQGWDRVIETQKQKVDAAQYNEETGGMETVKETVQQSVVLKDSPAIDLVPIENFLIDPGANWLDPINTSPYTIEIIPMYVVDILDKMEQEDAGTTDPKWKTYSVDEIRQAHYDDPSSDSTRMAKEGDKRSDPKDGQGQTINEYTLVWVYRVIARIPGEGDMVWYTLGKHLLLTDPKPVSEVYPHLNPGERPYVAGRVIIEAHRNYSSGLVELGQDIQAATNDNLNQRFDNVKQVLNKRYFVARQKEVDLKSLRRNVPGSITMMTDTERDVKVQETNDVTGSSYNEQNLFNADFDEVTGSFSSGSVQTNRQLNETVGGMKMLRDPSNTLTEYLIRTFAETWVAPVLDQFVRLIRKHESEDMVKLAAGDMVGEGEIDIRDAAVKVDVHVGFGVTDPDSRVRRLLSGMESIGGITPSAIQRLKEAEVVKEIMGILGYQDGARFFMSDQEFAQYQQQNPPQPDVEQIKIQSNEKIKAEEILSGERKEAARIDQDRLIWAERILSQERIEAARLTVQSGKDGAVADLELGKRAIEIEKLDNDKLKLAIQREDMLRKDAEIKDKEPENLNRSGGPSVEQINGTDSRPSE
jgi:hypothetical protein